MSFPRDIYPYTNFHELNLGYFIIHFREIFSQWADLYDQMTDWKDATDEELTTWKAGVEADLDQREAALRAELETWKAQTGQDIAGWEDATLAALTAWQTATQAVFEAIRVEAAGSASAAAASAGDAATAKTAAETAQAAAEAAAASIASSAAQIATNTADISDLKTQLNNVNNTVYTDAFLATGTDLNDYYKGSAHKAGFYRGNANGNTYYNLPDSVKDMFDLRVMFAESGTYTHQVLTSYNSSATGLAISETFVRGRSGTSWSRWCKDDLYLYDKAITAGTDLDTLAPGVYRADAGLGFTHLPDDVTSGMFELRVVYPDSGTYKHQVLIWYGGKPWVSVYVRSGNTYGAWKKDDSVFYDKAIPAGTDLNTLAPGLYRALVQNGFTNLPDDVTTGMIELRVINAGDSGTFRHQVLVYYGGVSVDIYVRSGSPTYGAWKKSNYAYYNKTLATGTDLNNVGIGIARGDSSVNSYTNIPADINGAFVLTTYNSDSGTGALQIISFYIPEVKTYYRQRVNNVWSAWYTEQVFYPFTTDENLLETYVTASHSGQIENAGQNLAIMTYNVANYNNDSATYLPDEKVLHFIQMLNDANPDIITTQEDRVNINATTPSKSASEYLYNPVYPYVHYHSTGSAMVRAKINALSNDKIMFSVGNRMFLVCVFEINNKKILVCTVHITADSGDGMDSEASKAMRNTQYDELLKWVNGDITLDSAKTTPTTPVYAPEHDYCIIGGDMNTMTSDDWTALTQKVNNYNFTMANGGRMGKMKTNHRTSEALDNIIVSPNIIINQVKVYNDLYDRLYSDHVPVLVNVTLT